MTGKRKAPVPNQDTDIKSNAESSATKSKPGRKREFKGEVSIS